MGTVPVPSLKHYHHIGPAFSIASTALWNSDPTGPHPFNSQESDETWHFPLVLGIECWTLHQGSVLVAPGVFKNYFVFVVCIYWFMFSVVKHPEFGFKMNSSINVLNN